LLDRDRVDAMHLDMPALDFKLPPRSIALC